MVSNAGGINPEACAAALRQAAKKAGVELKVTHNLEMSDSLVRNHTGYPTEQFTRVFYSTCYDNSPQSLILEPETYIGLHSKWK